MTTESDDDDLATPEVRWELVGHITESAAALEIYLSEVLARLLGGNLDRSRPLVRGESISWTLAKLNALASHLGHEQQAMLENYISRSKDAFDRRNGLIHSLAVLPVAEGGFSTRLKLRRNTPATSTPVRAEELRALGETADAAPPCLGTFRSTGAGSRGLVVFVHSPFRQHSDGDPA